MRGCRFARILCWSAAASLTLSACGSSTDQSAADDGDSASGSFAAAGDFDESQLPADFPKNLIPPDYDSGEYMQLGQIETASFENEDSVQDTFDYYLDLLGEPRLDSTSPEGQRTVQWDQSPWMVSVIGGAGESIIGFTKIPN